jgi:hypothetical protein
MFRPSTLTVIGPLLLLAGVLAPSEGSLAVFTGTGVLALGAYLTHSEQRRLLACASALVVVGVGGMVVLSAMGGDVSNAGRALWWLMLVPYVAGWILGLAGAALCLYDHLYEDHAGGGEWAPR